MKYNEGQPHDMLAKPRNDCPLLRKAKIIHMGRPSFRFVAEFPHLHHIAGKYLNAYAAEMAWRENNRRISNGEQYLIATSAALTSPVSRQWKGYWQRAV